MLLVFLKGFLMGVAIAAPVGPIGVLCIRRTLAQGRLIGLVSGCGAATADAFYGIIAAFGLSTLSTFLVSNTVYLQVIGGFFLCYLGVKTALSKSAVALDKSAPSNSSRSSSSSTSSERTSSKTTLSAYTTTLALTLTNPATILSFVAIFAGLGITQSDYLQSVTLVFGVFSGSLLWWLVLVSGVTYLRSRLTPERLLRFNRFASKVFGLVIFAFGIAALAASFT
ncbi:MAG: LysE family translocator [Phormidesmis sp.]